MAKPSIIPAEPIIIPREDWEGLVAEYHIDTTGLPFLGKPELPPALKKPDFALPFAVERPLRHQGNRDYQWVFSNSWPPIDYSYCGELDTGSVAPANYSDDLKRICEEKISIAPVNTGFVVRRETRRTNVQWIDDSKSPPKPDRVRNRIRYWQQTIVPTAVAEAICFDFGTVWESFPEQKQNGTRIDSVSELYPKDLPLVAFNAIRDKPDLVRRVYKSAGPTQSTKLIVAKVVDDALEGRLATFPSGTSLQQFRLAYLLLPTAVKPKIRATSGGFYATLKEAEITDCIANCKKRGIGMIGQSNLYLGLKTDNPYYVCGTNPNGDVFIDSRDPGGKGEFNFIKTDPMTHNATGAAVAQCLERGDFAGALKLRDTAVC